MNPYELVKKIKNKKTLDNEWFEFDKEIKEFVKTNSPEEERQLFVPLGYAEMVGMMCDGLKRRKNN